MQIISLALCSSFFKQGRILHSTNTCMQFANIKLLTIHIEVITIKQVPYIKVFLSSTEATLLLEMSVRLTKVWQLEPVREKSKFLACNSRWTAEWTSSSWVESEISCFCLHIITVAFLQFLAFAGPKNVTLPRESFI